MRGIHFGLKLSFEFQRAALQPHNYRGFEMSGQGKPFLSGGNYIRWNFADAHPNIEKLEMNVRHFQGGRFETGQREIPRKFTEKDMPDSLGCSAGCENGGIDLSRYLSGVESRQEIEDRSYINCKGSFGRSPKGRNPGQQCSHSQYNIHTKITYKNKR